MNWIDWIVWSGYVVGFLVTLKKLTIYALREMGYEENFDKTMALLLGGLGAAFWPLLVAGLLFKKILWPRGITVPPTKQEKKEKLERELADVKRRARQMARDHNLPWVE